MKDKKLDKSSLNRRPPSLPMPWMVLISIKGRHCVGTLINNEFVLTAANCFCAAAMLCDRVTMEVEDNLVNKIRVREGREGRFHFSRLILDYSGLVSWGIEIKGGLKIRETGSTGGE